MRRAVISGVLATLVISVTACGTSESSSGERASMITSEYPVPIPSGLRPYFEPAPHSAVCLPAPVWDGGDRARQLVMACELGWRMRPEVRGLPSVGGR